MLFRSGDDYVYGLGYQAKRQREGSEGLESQIEKELARRGYTLRGMCFVVRTLRESLTERTWEQALAVVHIPPSSMQKLYLLRDTSVVKHLGGGASIIVYRRQAPRRTMTETCLRPAAILAPGVACPGGASQGRYTTS